MCMANLLDPLRMYLWGTENNDDCGCTGSLYVPEALEEEVEVTEEEEEALESVEEYLEEEEEEPIILAPIGAPSSTTVILGTAHLCSTPGKCSPDKKFREYAYSRRLVKEIYARLVNSGYKCVIDWINDDMSGLNSSQELCKRASIVNNICAERGTSNCIYVSVHVNAAGGDGQWKNATGWAIYTSPGVTKSDTIATCLYEAAQEILCPLGKKIRTDFRDGDADFEENFYVLKHTNCPAVLTENFFQDCQSDVAWLESEEGFNAIVDIHVRGIIKYLSKIS